MTDGKLQRRTLNLTGQTFGWLTAIQPERSDGKKWLWRFRCVCGKHCIKLGVDVRRGKTGLHCGCKAAQLRYRPVTHGMSKHPAYAVYRSMIARCKLPSHRAWRNYGGRGITVCKSWQRGFQYFWADMGATYQRGLDLDRINNDGNYSPKNCRWSTRRMSAMNRRSTIRQLDIPTLATSTGISRSTLYYRIKHGWPLNALTRRPHATNRCTT